MNISWHDPDLYYFLTLLAGIAALLASLYEFSRPGRAKPQDVVDQPQVKPLPRAVPAPSGRATDAIARDGQSVPAGALLRDRSRPTEEKHVMEEIDESSRQAGERAAFSRLCESIKDLPPKEQVSRVHEYFGIFGGAPPPKGGGPGRERR
jgi:hypothetical protein